MHITHLVIRNFRALEDIDCDLSPTMNVIVGPNGVGKSTVLQATRLVKALLAPRIGSEAHQTLISLAAASPHFPQRVFLQGLARDPSKPVEVRCAYAFSEDELSRLKSQIPQIATNLVAAQAGQNFQNPAALIQFLQSPAGVDALSKATPTVTNYIDNLTRGSAAVLGLNMNAATGQILAVEPLAGPMIAYLDQSLPPAQSVFSYFPADRALPMGEVQMQLGAPDLNQQLEAHNSQPQLKFTRLKNLIINALVINDSDRESIKSDFDDIFSGLLRGRKLGKIGVNELGLLSVPTEDVSSGRVVDLDALSSGEKNIALTFLLIARSVAEGGIVLFDEPELHLNPAVCRDVLPFMMARYAIPKKMQFIVCTHSADILGSAFARDDCTLLHIVSPSNVTRLGRHALDEYAECLQRLGTSVSESLFYEGTIFVEGDNDVKFLEIAFPGIARRYNIKEKGGKKEVLKTLEQIQILAESSKSVSPIYVIFDKDNDIPGVRAGGPVGILRWNRYCLDNFLIDTDVLTEILKDKENTKSPISNEGELHKKLQDLAFEQLDGIAARTVYSGYGYENASLRREDVDGIKVEDISAALFDRLDKARKSLSADGGDAWRAKFEQECRQERTRLEPLWESKWRELCDGKKLLSRLHRTSDMRISEAALKEKIARKMRDRESENWQLVKSALVRLLGVADL